MSTNRPPSSFDLLASASRVLTLLICLVLLACTPPPTPSPTPTPQPSPTTAPTGTPTATATVTQTFTPLPTFTLTLSPTLTLTATQTLTPTPAAAFDQFQIISVSNGVGGISVVVKLPGVQVAYSLTILGREYACVLDAKTPDRLFCSGLASVPFDQSLDVVFLDPQTKQPVYSGKTIYSSALAAGPAPLLNGKNDCPQRGVNIHCETECRLLPNGEPCIVSTCTDACGIYRSIQTCPQDMPTDFASCPPALFDQMKARYNLP